MYPSGIDGNEEFLSLYLYMAKPDPDTSLQNSGVLVQLSLSIKDKVTSNRKTMTGLSLLPAPTVTGSRCSVQTDTIIYEVLFPQFRCMDLGNVCAFRTVPFPSDRGRWLGMGKVHGDEVCEGLVPCEWQLLNRGRCCHRWIVQDGIGIIRLSTYVRVCLETTLELCNVGFCFVDDVFLNDPDLNVAVHYKCLTIICCICCEVALLRPYV